MKHFILLATALLMALAPASYAATVKVKGFITKTVVADEGRWGGCMVSIDQKLADSGLDCPGKWVSFSCSGVFTEKDVAYRMFDQAQMATFNDYYIGDLENGLKYARMKLDFGEGLVWAITHFLPGGLDVSVDSENYTLSAEVLAFAEE